MISFNYNDVNMPTIANRAALFNLLGRYGYRIYGLKERNRPLIEIRFNTHLRDKAEVQLKKLASLFAGQDVKFTNVTRKTNHVFRIGLRRDLRANVDLTAKLLQVIIYTLEDRIEGLPDKLKIKI